ncbi:MAG: ankyrin repeat domain-containing protein [Alphaproteobacteria bacterium]
MSDDTTEKLFAAVEAGETGEVWQMARAGVCMNVFNAAGKTPLVIACEKANKAMANMIFGGGADANLATAEGTTPLHAVAAAKNTVPGMVSLMLLRGAHFNTRDGKGRTALDIAATATDEIRTIIADYTRKELEFISRDAGQLKEAVKPMQKLQIKSPK